MSSIIKVNTFQDTNGNALFNSDGSGNVTLSAGAMKNTPAFKVDMSSNQTLSNNTWTKMNLNQEAYDTDSAFDTSNYRFTVPSGKGGKYQFHTQAFIDSGSTSILNYTYLAYYVNGTRDKNLNHHNFTNSDIRSFSMSCAMQISLSAGDYVEIYVRANQDSGSPVVYAEESSGRTSFLEGFRLIGA